jgi:spermidine/putrescine transport system substrate-binding protein
MSHRQRIQLMNAAMNRRRFLGRTGVLLGGLALGPSVLAACGSDDDDDTSSSASTGASTDTGSLNFSNWPLYIDPTEDGVTGSVDLFKEETGIDLKYVEDYNDNAEFFAKIQPDLAAGNVIAQDIIAPTFWLVARLIGLGWVDELPWDEMNNAGNLVPALQKPAWDPEGIYSLPWQSGITGIAYNKAAAGRELKSVDDLFDPEFAGKVTLLSEWRDTIGLMMFADGKNPGEATFADAEGAFARLETAVGDKQIRKFTGNEYKNDLVAGNLVACVAWSGDVAQLALDNEDLAFVIPEEGGMLWSDCMVMPKGAENRSSAAKWFDYVYDPVNAARIAAWVQYMSPVAGVQDELRKSDDPAVAALADSPIMFPDDATLGNVVTFASLDEDEEAQFETRFNEISGG